MTGAQELIRPDDVLGRRWQPPETLEGAARQKAWSEAFNVAWLTGVTAIVTAGQILTDAKADIPPGEWLNWLALETPVSARTAQVLMRIANDPNILRYSQPEDPHYALPVLPNDRAVLTDLCGIESEEFDELVEGGIIHPEMRRGDLKPVRAAAAVGPAPPLPQGKFGAIHADPPWRTDSWGAGGTDRAPDSKYPTMTIEEIAALPVEGLAADNCVLFLWILPHLSKEAQFVIQNWGFTYSTTAFVWHKPDAFGLGYWTRKRTETCLLAKRGNPKRLNADVDEFISAPRTQHSEKPLETYTRIPRLVAGPYLDLFAREPREGWEVWGNAPGLLKEDAS